MIAQAPVTARAATDIRSAKRRTVLLLRPPRQGPAGSGRQVCHTALRMVHSEIKDPQGAYMPNDERSVVGWFRTAVFSARDSQRLAAFWTELLGLDVRVNWPDWIETDPGRGGVLLAFQPVADGQDPPSPGPISLDVEVTDLDAAQRRAEALGATLAEVVHYKPGEEHRVMADPEGNRFNLVLPFPPGWPEVDAK